MALPIGSSAEGLPVGGQLVGCRWDDLGLVAVAERVAAVAEPVAPPPGFGRTAV